MVLLGLFLAYSALTLAFSGRCQQGHLVSYGAVGKLEDQRERSVLDVFCLMSLCL